MNTKPLYVAVLAGLAACAPKRVDEEPIRVMQNGDMVPAPTAAVAVATEQSQKEYAEAQKRREELAARALAGCSGTVCEAIARGELALGMNEEQVMAATGTTEGAWTVRYAADAAVMVPRAMEDGPRDAAGRVAMVQLRNGRVGTYAYAESEGVRVVNEPADATTTGRAAARAEMLIREGDDYAARGDLQEALDRYDRAQVMTQDPMLEYRIAQILDKQLRPIEAQLRYRLFLHRLELEKIEAQGDAYAKIAAAMVQARERLIVLEKHGK